MNTVKQGLAIWIFLLATTVTVFGQTETEKNQRIRNSAPGRSPASNEYEIRFRRNVNESGQYQAADEKFVTILKSVKSVPSDLTFYFGKNSYYLGKYKQSVDWLNKYIQLKGTSGQFSQETINLKQKAEVELLKEKEQESKQALQVFAQDYDIDCGPTGKVTCPVCNGSTVIIKKGYISSTYKTCSYCNLKGVLSCEEYNKLLRGELKPSSN